jgi:catechol 2,3-dioxygenase-like lactoylglutathione lyase family enzyme
MKTREFRVHGLDHVQLAMPPEGESMARQFYSDILGMAEVAKPASLASKRGVWFASGSLRLHLGVEVDFRPARKAHPAFLVDHLDALIGHLQLAGIAVHDAEPLANYLRVHIADPFGNRIELMERLSESDQLPM